MNYWAPIVGTHLGDHMLHTFLSYNLSFPSLSPVTTLITPTNVGPVLMDFTFEFQKLRQTLDVLIEIITLMVNINVYDSLFHCCNRHRQLLHTYHLIP